MECHEGATMNKTFRGQVPNGGQDTIVLHTNDGTTGYRIKKFQLMQTTPGASGSELTCKIYSVVQTSSNGVVDFQDNTLLAVGTYESASGAGSGPNVIVVFDNMTFNQDIYVTAVDTAANLPTNYYLELEQVKLDLNENTVATLKDIRNKELRTMTA